MDSFEHDKTDERAEFVLSGATIKSQDFLYTISGTYVVEPPLGSVDGLGPPPISATGSFRYGQLVALSGDFFKTYEVLTGMNPDDLNLILQSKVYTLDADHDWYWILAMGALGPGTYSSYLGLAINNPEHFRGPPQIGGDGSYSVDPSRDPPKTIDGPLPDDSVNIYRLGHQSALNHAINAVSEADQYSAYAINAFYDHYLTDMFSASHLRVPRRCLHGEGPRSIGDFYTSRLMHDEDGKNGLYVTNSTGAVWKAYGDGYELPGKNPANLDNWDNCLDAVATSVQEITAAMTTKQVPSPEAYQALTIKPEAFPPGAEVHSDSKLENDYTVVMKRAPAGIDFQDLECYIWNYPDVNHALLVPAYLKSKVPGAIAALRNVGFGTGVIPLMKNSFLNGPFDDNTVQTLKKKPTYYISTTYTGSTTNPVIGHQTYPLYVIAQSPLAPSGSAAPVLYVRNVDVVSSTPEGTLEQGQDVTYVAAEYNKDDASMYDSSTKVPPPPTIRMFGWQQGYPPPV